MNRQLQIELWPECRCDRCKFCNLVLSSEMRGDGTHSNPNVLLSPEKKEIFIDNAIKFTYEADWKLYDELLIRGGEVFNDYDPIITDKFSAFVDRISELIKTNVIKKVFLITSLKFPYETSLLKYIIEKLQENNINLKENVLIGTSWDIKYRFTKKSLNYWNENIKILDEQNIPVHITSILTQAFINGFFENNPEVLNVMSRDFDFIAAQGKPELLFLNDFFPKRKDCIKFLTYLQNTEYYPIWYRLLHQNHRRAESIYFTEYSKMQIRDLETYNSVLEYDTQGVLKCGHPKEYANYVDSDACFLCDINTISGACCV